MGKQWNSSTHTPYGRESKNKNNKQVIVPNDKLMTKIVIIVTILAVIGALPEIVVNILSVDFEVPTYSSTATSSVSTISNVEDLFNDILGDTIEDELKESLLNMVLNENIEELQELDYKYLSSANDYNTKIEKELNKRDIPVIFLLTTTEYIANKEIETEIERVAQIVKDSNTYGNNGHNKMRLQSSVYYDSNNRRTLSFIIAYGME